MEATDEKRIGDYLIKIFPDEMAESPNDWYDEERFLVFDHRQFHVARKGYDPAEIFADGEKVKGFYVFRCYAYIHSGVALAVESHSFPDARWDVSFKGFWLIKRQKGTWTRDKALEAAQALCNVWNQYLEGDVYGYKVYKVTTCDKGHEHEEELDSCWGFYGEDVCMKEAEGIVEYYLQKENSCTLEDPCEHRKDGYCTLAGNICPTFEKLYTNEQSEVCAGSHSD